MAVINQNFTIIPAGCFEYNNPAKMIIAKNYSTLLSALKTILPMPKPNGRVTPGALNFNHDSIKLIADMKPIQMNVDINIIEAIV